jgi:predicted dinucleotide-binding enzyme
LRIDFASSHFMRIGIIGCGNIGSTLARLWVEAGHEVIVSSRHPQELEDFAHELGDQACAASAEEAAQSGDVVLLSIPLGTISDLSNEVRRALQGKIVLDTCNPYPERDGEAAYEVRRMGLGTGRWTSNQLPGARIVRAFNSVPAALLQSESHRGGEDPIGVPLATDDPEALSIAVRLVQDAGFAPVIAGDLNRSKDFDPQTPPYASGARQSQLKQMLGLEAEPHQRKAA